MNNFAPTVVNGGEIRAFCSSARARVLCENPASKLARLTNCYPMASLRIAVLPIPLNLLPALLYQSLISGIQSTPCQNRFRFGRPALIDSSARVNRYMDERNLTESPALNAPLMELRTCDSDCAPHHYSSLTHNLPRPCNQCVGWILGHTSRGPCCFIAQLE